MTMDRPGGVSFMNQTVFLAFAALLTIVVLQQAVRYMLVRRVGKKALAEVGKRAMLKLPDSVCLSRVESPTWTNGELVGEQSEPLLRSGFQDAGVYRVDRMPGVFVRILCEPRAGVVAYVYDHPHAGSWTEMVTRYRDGSTNCVTTMSPTGMRHPHWFRKIHADKTMPTNRIYERFLPLRQQQGITPVAPGDTSVSESDTHEFEATYRKLAAWRLEAGISPKEVAHVAVKWIREKQANAIEQY